MSVQYYRYYDLEIGSTMSVQYYRKYDLAGRTYGIVYRDSSSNFGAVLALRDDGELEPEVSTLKYLDYIISKEGIEARVERNTIYSQCLVREYVTSDFSHNELRKKLTIPPKLGSPPSKLS